MKDVAFTSGDNMRNTHHRMVIPMIFFDYRQRLMVDAARSWPDRGPDHPLDELRGAPPP